MELTAPDSELSKLWTPSDALLRMDSRLDIADEQELSPLLKNLAFAAAFVDSSSTGFGAMIGGLASAPRLIVAGT